MTRTEWWIAWLCAGAVLVAAFALTGCQTAPKTLNVPLPAVEYSTP